MARAEASFVRVSVVYLRPGGSFERSLVLPAPATVAQAIKASGIVDELPQLGTGDLAVGVFSRPCEPSQPLRDGDRVEIYRPLTLDPKQARRIRSAVRRRRKTMNAPS